MSTAAHTHGIGLGKVNVATTMPREMERQIARLAYANHLSRNEYMRRLAAMAIQMGMQFTKPAALLSLLAVTLWVGALRGDEFARLARGKRGRRDSMLELIEEGEA